jgi:drug/metabolite transporter (DMT)-like permease
VKHAYTWAAIFLMVTASVTGDVLLSKAMKQIGDVGDLWKNHGILRVVGSVLRHPLFALGIAAMAVAFFALLFGLSWGDVSLIAPASASLTFAGNMIAAKLFLHERVDRRRCIAVALVACGVVLLAF